MTDAINNYLTYAYMSDARIPIRDFCDTPLGWLCLIVCLTSLIAMMTSYCISRQDNEKAYRATLISIISALTFLVTLIPSMVWGFQFFNLVTEKPDTSKRTEAYTLVDESLCAEYKVNRHTVKDKNTYWAEMVEEQDKNGFLSITADPFYVKSLDPTDDEEYPVFIVKQNDNTWQLCRRNEQGEYIPLNPEHTIQDLKEN